MIKPTTITLPNQLRLVVSPIPLAESVTVMILVRAGSRFESPAQNGIAHFLEHMFFKGGEKYPTARAVSEAIEGIGGIFNAFTANEYVGYYIKVAKGKLGQAFDVLSDMFHTAHFDAASFTREKGVILEEYRMYQDNPKALVSMAFDRALYGDHPLGRMILGTPQNIKGFTRDDLVAYEQALYTPANMVISVAGGTTAAHVKKLATKYFPLPRRGKPNRPRPVSLTTSGRFEFVAKRTEQVHVVLGLHTFGGKHKDRYVAELLASILGGGMSSRLFLNVREELGLAYYIYAHHQAYTDTGYFAVHAGVDKRRLPQALKVIRQELLAIAQDGVSEAELTKAKEYWLGNLTLELENSDEIAYLFGAQTLLYGATRSLPAITHDIRAVGVADIKRLARQFFLKTPLSVAAIGDLALSGKIKQTLKQA